MQAREEVHQYVKDIDGADLWTRPAGAASVGFHLQHLTGVLDRLFTYARNESLSKSQFKTFEAEGKADDTITLDDLLTAFDKTVDGALETLQNVDVNALTNKREVGRAKLPTTLLGLYTHAAEHTMRHVGQLLVTAKVLHDSADVVDEETTSSSFTIDHFDDNDLAVLESSAESLIVPRAFLPSGAKEGGVLRLEKKQSETETNLHFKLDVSATEAVLESASALRANLKRAPSGDIEL